MLALDHVQLAAPPGCEAAARAFFCGLLGLTERPKEGDTARSGGCWFQTGTLQVHVGVQADFQPARKAHIALRAASPAALRALAARLQEAGHPVRWDTRLPNTVRFFTTDPWENRLEVLALSGPRS